ncbi:hypothetical protein NC651_026984 [Populus alba x Populus x berolinensis]|nr:hypothetical protein NC651_026984 [Populus alba x Populus x berolinensis]
MDHLVWLTVLWAAFLNIFSNLSNSNSAGYQISVALEEIPIIRCNKITASSVSVLVEHCKSLQTLRCGGCPRSDYTARCCLTLLKPTLDDMVGDSWEELDTAEISHNAESLHWLVWPNIDKDSLEILATECPRISVNPKRSPFGFRGKDIPIEAFPDTALDDLFVQEINPSTWAASGFTLKPVSPILSNSKELSLAEKFRLAFVERDTRLAPKRAKNARQHQRRLDREWMTMSAEAKAIVLASQVSKSLHGDLVAIAKLIVSPRKHLRGKFRSHTEQFIDNPHNI